MTSSPSLSARMRCYAPVMERLYGKYNRTEFLSPDPVEVVRRYDKTADREVAGLIASCLAYGRASLIVASVERVLSPMGSSPARFLREAGSARLSELFRDFRHRFTDGQDMIFLLEGIGAVLRRWGSLENCFAEGLLSEADEDAVPALISFVNCLKAPGGDGKNSLLPSPGSGSACKRLHLFLKWMVRSDEIDPGGWVALSPSRLLIPLDTHMGRISRSLALTSRRQDDLRTAREVTRAFRLIVPEDPARYDFVLTRFGIRADLETAQLFRICSEVL